MLFRSREVDSERKRRLTPRERVPFSGGMEMEVKPAAGKTERRGRSGVRINGRLKLNGFVNGRKTPPLPNILFSGSPTPTPTSPSLRRKGC